MSAVTVGVEAKDNASPVFEKVGQNIDKMGGKVQKNNVSMKESHGLMDSLGNVLRGNFSGGLGAASGAAAGMGAALVAGVVAVDSFVGKMAKAVEQLQLQAETVGLTVQQYQEMTFAFEDAGISSEKMTAGLVKLDGLVGQAASGQESAIKTLEKWGIAWKNADGTTKESNELMSEVADRIQSIEDPALRVAAAKDLMGKSGATLIPVLKDGADALAAQAKEAENLGYVIGEDTVEALNKADAANDKFGHHSSAVFSRLAGELAPGATDSVNSLSDALAAIEPLLMGVGVVINKVMQAIGLMMNSIIMTLKVVVYSAVYPLMQLVDQVLKLGGVESGVGMDAFEADMSKSLNSTAEKTTDSFANLFGFGDSPAPKEEKKDGKGFKPKATTNGKGGTGHTNRHAPKEIDYEKLDREAKEALDKEYLKIRQARWAEQSMGLEADQINNKFESDPRAKAEKEFQIKMAKLAIEFDKIKYGGEKLSQTAEATAKKLFDAKSIELEKEKTDALLKIDKEASEKASKDAKEFAQKAIDAESERIATFESIWTTARGIATQVMSAFGQAENAVTKALDGIVNATIKYMELMNKMQMASLAGTPMGGMGIASGALGIAASLFGGFFADGGVIPQSAKFIRVNEQGRSESVLNASATAALGQDRINALNKGDWGRAQISSSPMVVNIHTASLSQREIEQVVIPAINRYARRI